MSTETTSTPRRPATQTIRIDARDYRVRVIRRVSARPEAVRILIASYLPTTAAMEILQACIASVQRNTPEPHELWVIDNHSPRRNIEWLLDRPNLNVALSQTEPVPPQHRGFRHWWDGRQGQQAWGSYSNAVALELGARLIDPATQWVLAMHSDAMVLRPGWLTFLCGKTNGRVRAAANFASRGAGHVSGLLFDFQLFRQLGVTFLPNIAPHRDPARPEYDVGDLVTLRFQEHGYDVWICENTYNEPELVRRIPSSDPLRHLQCDRSFNALGEVFYVHLGRGVSKATGTYDAAKKTYPDQWLDFARSQGYAAQKPAGSEPVAQEPVGQEAVGPASRRSAGATGSADGRDARPTAPSPAPCNAALSFNGGLDYSIRRHYVDQFYLRHVPRLAPGSRVLDLGGERVRKRGLFDIEGYNLCVVYANLSTEKRPDVKADAGSLPLRDAAFDAIICSETLLYLPEPAAALRESFRVLRPGGRFLGCVPFQFRMVPADAEFGLYTESYWRRHLAAAGFTDVRIERQGAFGSVLMDMVRDLAARRRQQGRPRTRLFQRLVDAAVRWGIRKALAWDDKEAAAPGAFAEWYRSYTTGFGLWAVRPRE